MDGCLKSRYPVHGIQVMTTVLVEYWILLSRFVLQEDVYYCNLTKYVCLVDGLTDHNKQSLLMFPKTWSLPKSGVKFHMLYRVCAFFSLYMLFVNELLTIVRIQFEAESEMYIRTVLTTNKTYKRNLYYEHLFNVVVNDFDEEKSIAVNNCSL